MSQNQFPDGWDANRVRKVLAHYDRQPEDEALAEDETGVASAEKVMNVPHDLVPQVRELTRLSHLEGIFDYFCPGTGVKLNACNGGISETVAVKTYPL